MPMTRSKFYECSYSRFAGVSICRLSRDSSVKPGEEGEGGEEKGCKVRSG